MNKIKLDRRAKQAELDALCPEVERLTQDAQEKKEIYAQQDKLASKTKAASDNFKLQARKILAEIEEIDEKDQGLCQDGDMMHAALKGIDKKVHQLGQNIRKKEDELNTLRIQLENAGPPPAGIEKQISKATGEYKAAADKVSQISKKLREAGDKEKEHRQKIAAKQRIMDNFRDVKTERLNKLKLDNYTASKACYAARMWLGESLNRLRAHRHIDCPPKRCPRIVYFCIDTIVLHPCQQSAARNRFCRPWIGSTRPDFDHRQKQGPV